MKSLIYILLATVFACSWNTNQNHEQKKASLKVGGDSNKNNDTTVCSVTIPDDTEKEYFLIIHNDTSHFSLFVNLNSQDEVVAKYGYGSDKRGYRNILADSAAIKAVSNEMVSYPKVNYSQQLEELKLLFNGAAQKFNLQGLVSFRVSITNINGLSENINREYITKYGEKIKPGSNKDASAIIMSSKFVTDLNNILLEYNVMIDKIFIDGLVYYKAPNSPINCMSGLVIFVLKQTD